MRASSPSFLFFLNWDLSCPFTLYRSSPLSLADTVTDTNGTFNSQVSFCVYCMELVAVRTEKKATKWSGNGAAMFALAVARIPLKTMKFLLLHGYNFGEGFHSFLECFGFETTLAHVYRD